jgi:hypothetical protein
MIASCHDTAALMLWALSAIPSREESGAVASFMIMWRMTGLSSVQRMYFLPEEQPACYLFGAAMAQQ